MGIPFWKLQSTGNDFVLVCLADVPDSEELGQLSLRACERRFGIGADGLLAVGREEGDLRLRMFNPDGTEDFCGNGIGCAALFAHGELGFPEAFVVRHLGRAVPVAIQTGGVQIGVGEASFEPDQVPLREGLVERRGAMIPVLDEVLQLWAVTTGSTHTVALVPELPDNERFERLSSALEMSEDYPERTSVIWCAVESEARVRVRIWERGVGETLGCGTGAAAAACSLGRSGLVGPNVEIVSHGGVIVVDDAAKQAGIAILVQPRLLFRGVLASSTP